MLFSWRVLLPALRLLRVLLVYVVVEPTVTPELNVSVPAPVVIPKSVTPFDPPLSLITFLTIVRLPVALKKVHVVVLPDSMVMPVIAWVAEVKVPVEVVPSSSLQAAPVRIQFGGTVSVIA